MPNIFGKWCRPNYNSVVATFCHNVARGLPIRVDDREAMLSLVYIDDVVAEFVRWLRQPPGGLHQGKVEPIYQTTLGELADQIAAFAQSRETLVSERVGTGLTRALYATYVSYLPPEHFAYPLPRARRRARHLRRDAQDQGQRTILLLHRASWCNTRGGHYHHSKTEKFLVLKGQACFRFRNILSDEEVQIQSSGDEPLVVETIPGWAHDITNVGADELLVMLWANEIFDPRSARYFRAGGLRP